MERSLSIAMTGLEAQRARMAAVANNLANANTTGFKKDRVMFDSLMYQNFRQVGAQSSNNTQLPTGLSLGTGARVVATEKQHVQGEIKQTGRDLDLAIEGRGFFQVLLPDGTLAYTRNGIFHMDAQGQLVNSQGFVLQPGITIPTGAINISISEDGIVSYLSQGDTTPTQVGTIQLTDFVNPAGLQAISGTMFRETAASGTAQTGTAGLNGLGFLKQGAIETSNVNVVEELVAMIETQRAYEMNSKAISTVDEMLQYTNQNL